MAALLVFLPSARAAAPELIYTVVDGQAVITGAEGPLTGQLLIPEEIDGYRITGIADGAFQNETGLISVVIEARLERLGSVFCGCTALTESVLPEGLVTLRGTFTGCTALEEIYLPASVRYLGSQTFCETGLRALRLPDGLREIGAACFAGTPLREIALPSGLERIDSLAFPSLPEQRYLSIPASVKYIGERAFAGKLDFVLVRGAATGSGSNPFPQARAVYCYRDAPIYRNLGAAAVFYEELPCSIASLPVCLEGGLYYAAPDGEAIVLSAPDDAQLTIPQTLGGLPVTMLAPLCFSSDGERAAELTLPDTLRWVGRSAVYARQANLPQQLEYAGEKAFCDVSLTGEPHFLSLVTAERESFRGCGLTEAVFGTALHSLGERAFAMNRLEKVTLPEGVQTLGAEVFAWNMPLTELTVPASVTQCDDCLKNSSVARVYGYLDSAIEAYCERAEITFVNLLTGEEGAGARLVTLDHIKYKIFPSSSRAWIVGCEPQLLTGAVVVPAEVEGATVERVCDSAFAQSSAETIQLPDTVRVLEDWSFAQCSKLTYVEIPKRLERVFGTPFAACEKLQLLYLPSSFRRSDSAPTHLGGLKVLAGYVGTDAEQLAQDEGVRFLALPRDVRLVMGPKGIFFRETEGLTALYVCMSADAVVVPDEVQGEPVLRLAAGSIGNPEKAALGANVLYVEKGAFFTEDGAALRLRQLVVPPSVIELPPRLSNHPDFTIFGTTGTYADRYAAENGYRFLDRATTPFRDVSRSAWYHDAVRTVYWNGLMNGMSANTFAPNETATRAMVAKILANMSGIRDFTWSYGFSDVPDDAWYAPAVNWGAMVGIIQGTSKTTFSPEAPMTREQLVTLLYRFARACGVDVSTRADLSGYDDSVQVSPYAVSAMQWAVGVGILHGTSERTLSPASHATRSEIAQLLCNFLHFTGRTRNTQTLTIA